MTTSEEWRPVVGYEGRYEVSNLGRVRSREVRVYAGRGRTRISRSRFLSIQTKDRYAKVNLKVDGKQHFVYVHRLVMAAFVGPCPDGMEVCHNNGDPLNNCLGNLRYDTHSANQLDSVRLGVNPYSSRTHCKNGHAYTAENTRPRPGSHTGRRCLSCERERSARRLRERQERRARAQLQGEPVRS